MRSIQRDQTGYITFSGSFNGTTGGKGISNGVAWQVLRAALGQYVIYIDSAFAVFSANANNDVGQALVYGLQLGRFSINSTNTAGVLGDANMNFTATVRKLGG